MSDDPQRFKISARASPIFFLHNPKAGGSSLRSVFEELFPQEQVAPVFSNAPHDHRNNGSALRDQRGFAFYAGHYGYDAYRQLRDGHSLVTNFRDPVERIVSLYRYWRNNVRAEDLVDLDPRDAAIVMLAKELDFAAFIRCDDQDLRLYTSNFHFRQLYRSGWTNLSIGRWHMVVVKRRIARMKWFYVAELPHISSMLLRHCFGDLAASKIPTVNNSGGPSIKVCQPDADHIIRNNVADYEIFYHALRVQNDRFRRLNSKLSRNNGKDSELSLPHPAKG